MSYDELPPDSQPPRPAEDQATKAAQEASAPDAPPAASARRGRRKAAGTAAASDPSSVVSERSIRTTQRRRKTAATSEPTAPVTPPAAVDSVAPAPLVETQSASEPSASPQKSRRGRRAAAKPAIEAATPAEQASAPVVEPPHLSSGEPSAPTPARRGRRRKSDLATAIAVPPEETSSPIPATEQTAAPPEAPAPRRRGGRGRKPVPATEPPAQSPAEAPYGSVVEGAAAPVDSGVEVERPAKRRRTSRRRTTAVEERPEAESVAAQDPVAIPPAPGEETETGKPRSRRGRRGGRGRRAGVSEEMPEAGARAPHLEELAEEREERVDRTVGAHLVSRHGMPEIHINGVSYPPVLFFGNMEGAPNTQRVVSEVRRAAQAGVHLHSTLVELPCPLTEATEALDAIDDRLKAILDADPQGYVMPRLVFVPARGWRREYPTEIATYADGTNGDPSITSERFWQEAERSLTALIAHLRTMEWGKRVFGYHLERGEWFQPMDQGYDRSTANRDAFRDWLREKYKNSLVALRAAWYDGDVQFHTAEIPPLLTKPNPQRAFYESRRERRYIDFHEFTSESTARRLIALARAVKKATSNQALVSVCYGYTFEFGHPFSGHLALGLLLSAQAINLICGPPSYRDRKPGGGASYPAPVDSMPLHGKLWLSEDDTKTYLAPHHQDPDDFNPRLGDRFATEQAQTRAMGKALAHSTAIGWMDLWGEGWLDEESIWDRLGAFTHHYGAWMRHRERPRIPEVVALIDEKSLLHVQRGESFFRRITSGQRDMLQRAGVSYGLYLQSDLLARDFPTDAKLYLFLTPYRLTTDQRAAIKEKLQRDGKTLAWLYAPGACEERPTVGAGMEETATGAVGIVLRQQEWNSEIGSRVIEPYHPVTERLPSRDIGTRERLNPSFYVDDPEATVLAEYHGSGLPSLAVRNLGSWKSVFVGDPVLPLELLRGVCRYAGVHLWTPQGDDIMAVGNGWVMLHATRDGQRTIRLPEPTGIYDVVERRLVADEAREYRLFLRMGATRLFCIGATEALQRRGLPNISLPDSGRARIVLDHAQEPPVETPPASLRADLETLEAVLRVDIEALERLETNGVELPEEIPSDTPLTQIEATEPVSETGETAANGRRRRRRGGRGRGRRRAGGLSETGEMTPHTESQSEGDSTHHGEGAPLGSSPMSHEERGEGSADG